MTLTITAAGLAIFGFCLMMSGILGFILNFWRSGIPMGFNDFACPVLIMGLSWVCAVVGFVIFITSGSWWLISSWGWTGVGIIVAVLGFGWLTFFIVAAVAEED